MYDIPTYAVIVLALPDKRIVLQRRTIDAPYAPGLLGFFGGSVEPDESVDTCMVRELAEETSLPVDSLTLEQVTDFIIPAGEDYPKDRHIYLYTAAIPTMEFEVFEGDHAEAYTVEEALQRDDLAHSTAIILDYYGK